MTDQPKEIPMVLKARRKTPEYEVLRYDGTNIEQLKNFINNDRLFSHDNISNIEYPCYAVKTKEGDFVSTYSIKSFINEFVFVL
jgi:hypothetical protein